MLFLTIIKVALRSLYANKLRSILAMLGIIIGVGAVISMLSIGAGAQKDIMDRISSMGTNLLSIRGSRGQSRGVATEARKPLTMDDAGAIFAEVEGIEKATPVVESNAQLKYYNANTRTGVTGAAATYPSI
ncbi:MAG: ABC transporter permease, partial [bacterium]